MIEKILKETYVTPKVELTQDDYNRLVSMAKMKAKKIEERAREIYDEEGVVKIEFDGRFVTRRYGERETEHYEFDASCKSYNITPTGEYEKTLFTIPQESRERIAKKVSRYVEDVFVGQFGEHLYKINEIRDLAAKKERDLLKYNVLTLTGWLLAVLMFAVVLLK